MRGANPVFECEELPWAPFMSLVNRPVAKYVEDQVIR